MLTDAQYRALKAWPDGQTLAAKIGDKRMVSMDGIVRCISSNSFYACFVKVQPACDDAIREYEAAHNINQTKEKL